MRSLRRFYYDLFSGIYDLIIRLHSRDREGLLRHFIAGETRLAKGDRALDLCTGTGSVAAGLAKAVGEPGLVVGLDFSMGMLGKAKAKSRKLNLDRLFPVQAYAHRLPFKHASFEGVTCSHAFYELKGNERNTAVDEVARVLKKGGRFCLMEHAQPQRPLLKFFFHIRILFLGSGDARNFFTAEESIFPKHFKNVRKMGSPTGQSTLVYGEKDGGDPQPSVIRRREPMGNETKTV